MRVHARKLRIALGDLSYINDDNAQTLYVPLNLGYLAAYAKRQFGNEIEVRLYKDPHKLLREAEDWRPDLVGLSLYYWQSSLNAAVVRSLQRRLPSAQIVMGGPSIDTDLVERNRLLAQYPGVRLLIPNEGEEGFASLIGGLLAGDSAPPVLGMGLSTDLDLVPSPYEGGLLDEFLDGSCYPMIQTSRLCPYTCSFCVSGKNRGKLRAFSLEQVRFELEYLAQRFQHLPDQLLYITDENFGIMERDIEVAQMLVDMRAKYGWPRKIFYYNDKRFTQLSRTIHEMVGDMCHHGVMLSQQSENPETLKIIKRRNLTDEQIRSAIDWAHGLGLKVSTELIFGLPSETRATFLALLDRCAWLGFDVIQCYNLIIFPGIEMARETYREQHRVETRRRPIHAHVGVIDGEEVREHEEVAVSSNTFDEADYRLVRMLNVFFHTIFVLGVEKQNVQQAVASGASLSGMLLNAMTVGLPSTSLDEQRSAFLFELGEAITAELAEAEAELPKLQPVFASRLVSSDAWFRAALREVAVREPARAVA